MPKKIGNNIYMHKSALRLFTDEWSLMQKALYYIPVDFEFEILKINTRTNEVSFIASENWDTAPEPFVGDSYKVNLNTNKVTYRKARTTNKQIYHHKWMFVNDDYSGFDVEESKARSKAWQSLDISIDKKKIGNYDYWAKNVLIYLDK